MGDYLQELSVATGLPAYKKKGPYAKVGSVIGVRNGYLSAMGPATVNRVNSVNIFIRFREGSDQAAILQALSTNEGFLQAIDEKKWKKSIETSFSIGADFLQFDWKYSLRKPSAEKVAAVQTAIIEAIRAVAPPVESRCDMCKAPVSTPMLYNGIPGYYCSSCQSKTHGEQDAAAVEYATRETNFPRGLLFGILAAIVGALAWGGVAYALNYIFLYGAVLIGFLIAKAVFYGIGKINLAGQIAVFVLTIASVLLGDAIFFTLYIMKADQVAFSANLLMVVLKHMWEIETASDGNGAFTMLFAFVGAGIVVYSNRKPKFVATFEPLEAAQPVTAEVAYAGK